MEIIQDALKRVAIKKKYCKGAKNCRNKKAEEECYKKYQITSSNEFD
jgi:hypothetical protein